MKKIIKKLYSCSMTPEVTVRRIFYLLPSFQKYFKNRIKNSVNAENQKLDKKILFTQINKTNISEGDLVIVHSSMDSLNRFDISPKDIIDFLLKLIGDTGTLAMPAFPFYKKGIINNDKIENLYNTRLKLCSTGMLPNIFLRYPKVVRSKFTYNNLSAVGPLED
jgi:aminoglycoside 3-N-acetyltransferase